MRKWMMNIHLYAGLLCSSYLVIYGLSSLHFNHKFDWPSIGKMSTTRTRTVDLPEIRDNEELANLIRRELGLFGWPLKWTFSRDGQGDFSYVLARPGKNYKIRYTRQTDLVSVGSSSRGFWPIMGGMHGLSGQIPNAPIYGWRDAIPHARSLISNRYLRIKKMSVIS
jgi:hypothetical protein